MTEKTAIERDRELSFSIINYLSASFKGKLAELTLLGQLSHPDFDEVDLERTQKINDRSNTWLADCLRGESLFSSDWLNPESFEAQDALNLLEKLKPDLIETAKKIERYNSGLEVISVQAVQWLLAVNTRSAYARDAYIRGFISFSQVFKKQDVFQNYSALIPSSEDRIFSINQGVQIFKASDFDLSQLGNEFLETLISLCDDLPYVFKTHMHDINILVANFKGGITAENLGFSPEEAQEWESKGFPLDAAGYWRAYEFCPETAVEWINQAGARDPASAFAWKLNKFGPTDSKIWIEHGIPVGAAKLWGEAGYTPEQTREQLQRGLMEPEKK
jgi:hypothetical protein